MILRRLSARTQRSRRPISAEAGPVVEPILKVEKIHTFIGKHHILQGVSLEAYPGRVTVLLGRNGAGKTTTLRTIMGLLTPAEGAIFFKNQNLSHLKS